MARYADTLLADGERVVLRTRQHPFATIVDGRRQWALLIASLVLLALSLQLNGIVRDFVGWVVLVGIVFSGSMLVVLYWSWYAQDYLVTNRRVLKVEGIINKRSADSSLEKINDAVLEQNLFGRILDYGDLNILTAADVDLDEFRMLHHAPHFKRQMLNQKHELESEVVRMPSPPFRAMPSVAEMSPVDGPGAFAEVLQNAARPVAPPAQGSPPLAPPPLASPPPSAPPVSATAAPSSMPVAAVAAPPRATTAPPDVPPPTVPAARPPGSMTAAEIVDAVSRLASLRDSGAITVAEFEAKKTELLHRL